MNAERQFLRIQANALQVLEAEAKRKGFTCVVDSLGVVVLSHADHAWSFRCQAAASTWLAGPDRGVVGSLPTGQGGNHVVPHAQKKSPF